MSFGGYETSFLVSGLAMGAASLLPDAKAKDRLALAGMGGGMVVYSIYVAAQTSGTYVFPLPLLVLPWVLLGKALYDSYASGGQAAPTSTTAVTAGRGLIPPAENATQEAGGSFPAVRKRARLGLTKLSGPGRIGVWESEVDAAPWQWDNVVAAVRDEVGAAGWQITDLTSDGNQGDRRVVLFVAPRSGAKSVSLSKVAIVPAPRPTPTSAPTPTLATAGDHRPPAGSFPAARKRARLELTKLSGPGRIGVWESEVDAAPWQWDNVVAAVRDEVGTAGWQITDLTADGNHGERRVVLFVAPMSAAEAARWSRAAREPAPTLATASANRPAADSFPAVRKRARLSLAKLSGSGTLGIWESEVDATARQWDDVVATVLDEVGAAGWEATDLTGDGNLGERWAVFSVAHRGTGSAQPRQNPWRSLEPDAR